MRVMRKAGMTTSDLRHARLLAMLPDEAFVEGRERASDRFARKLLKQALKQALADADDDAARLLPARASAIAGASMSIKS
jgi:hypothetical protein